MAQLHELTTISERKRMAQAQCELCRRSLRLQLATFSADTAWFQRGLDSVARYRSFLWIVAPAAGFLIARRGKMLRRLLIRGVAGWQLMSRFWRWFKLFRRPL
jgi:hypothetical protein